MPARFRPRRAATLLVLLAACGARAGHPVPQPIPAVFDPAHVLRFTWEGRDVHLQGVRLDGDSISGRSATPGIVSDATVRRYPRRVLERATIYDTNAGGLSTTGGYLYLGVLAAIGFFAWAMSGMR